MIKENKKSMLSIDMLIVIILAILVIVLVFFFMYRNTILDWFKNLPGYEPEDKDKLVEELPPDLEIMTKYYKVAVILDGKYIRFCTEGDCNNLEESNLYWDGTERKGEIYVLQKGVFDFDLMKRDRQVGSVRNNRVYVDSEILGGTGSVYLNVRNELPRYEKLLNLDDSVYISGILYKKDGIVMGWDNHFLENYVEEGEKIEKSPEDISYYYPNLGKDRKTQWIKLEEPIDNEDNKLGVDTGGDELSYVRYANQWNKTWVRFKDGDYFEDQSEWVEMNYWNKYRSFARLPITYRGLVTDDLEVVD